MIINDQLFFLPVFLWRATFLIVLLIEPDPIHLPAKKRYWPFVSRTSSFYHRCSQAVENSGPCLWFVLKQDALFLVVQQDRKFIPKQQTAPIPARDIAYSRCIGVYHDLPCMVIELREQSADHGLQPVGLREAHAHIGEDFWAIAGRASQIVRWRTDHRFCGRCSSGMEEQQHELLKRCPRCGFVTYPRLSPAVIMSVIKDDAILLGRAPRFPPGMYSVLAGFVEPGETLEQAVAREVKEEVDIDITDIRYIGSQPWPFPHSLMIGFTAGYAGGAIAVDHAELEDARWFTATDMPRLPPGFSIARRLIELYLREHSG